MGKNRRIISDQLRNPATHRSSFKHFFFSISFISSFKFVCLVCGRRFFEALNKRVEAIFDILSIHLHRRSRSFSLHSRFERRRKKQQIIWQGDSDASISGKVDNKTWNWREEKKGRRRKRIFVYQYLHFILLLLSFRSQIDCIILCVTDFNVSRLCKTS